MNSCLCCSLCSKRSCSVLSMCLLLLLVFTEPLLRLPLLFGKEVLYCLDHPIPGKSVDEYLVSVWISDHDQQSTLAEIDFSKLYQVPIGCPGFDNSHCASPSHSLCSASIRSP